MDDVQQFSTLQGPIRPYKHVNMYIKIVYKGTFQIHQTRMIEVLEVNDEWLVEITFIRKNDAVEKFIAEKDRIQDARQNRAYDAHDNIRITTC